MSRFSSAVVIAVGLAGTSAAGTVSFEGSALVKGSKVTVGYRAEAGTRPEDATGVVTVNSRVFRLVCAEVQALSGPARAAEVAFWGRGVATDGGVVVIAARDGGRADQGGVVLAKRATPGDAAHCGAGDVSMTTIEAGDRVAVANIPDFEPPQVGSPSAAGHRRILTYNVAFLHATATYPSGLPPLPSCWTSCDPIELPPFPHPCGRSEMTMWPNDHRFGNLGEVERAEKIAERIVATDQDVVVLNELFRPGAREALVKGLAVNGPCKHYVSLFRGHAPVEGLTLNDIIAEKAGDVSAFLKTFLENQPDLFDYEAVPNPSGIAISSKYPFLQLEGSNVVDDGVCPDPECRIVGQNAGLPIQPGFYAFDASTTRQGCFDCRAGRTIVHRRPPSDNRRPLGPRRANGYSPSMCRSITTRRRALAQRIAFALGVIVAVAGCAPVRRQPPLHPEPTIADRVAQYGPAARARLAPFFRAAGVPYPPGRLVLLGLKQERELQLFAAGPGCDLAYVRSYAIQGASGVLGPKLRQGDRQVPEGIYSIAYLNPNSVAHLSLALGYPNDYDLARAEEDGRELDSLGGSIMIHGGSASIGCLAVGDEAAEDLFVLAADAGQENVVVVVSPVDFRRSALPAGYRVEPPWVGNLYDWLRTWLDGLPLPPEPARSSRSRLRVAPSAADRTYNVRMAPVVFRESCNANLRKA